MPLPPHHRAYGSRTTAVRLIELFTHSKLRCERHPSVAVPGTILECLGEAAHQSNQIGDILVFPGLENLSGHPLAGFVNFVGRRPACLGQHRFANPAVGRAWLSCEMSSAYFLPKSAEILLQQLLIAVIIVRLIIVGSFLGVLAPWLMLRLRGGFLVSYIVHWSLYAWLAPLFWSG